MEIKLEKYHERLSKILLAPHLQRLRTRTYKHTHTPMYEQLIRIIHCTKGSDYKGPHTVSKAFDISSLMAQRAVIEVLVRMVLVHDNDNSLYTYDKNTNTIHESIQKENSKFQALNLNPKLMEEFVTTHQFPIGSLSHN